MTRAAESLREIELAAHIQKTTRQAEKDKRDDCIDYDEKHVRQSIVHTREDIILLVSINASILSEVKANNRRLNVIILIITLALLAYLLK